MTGGDATRGATYRLVVRGQLGDRFASLFEGMRMERLAGTTIVTGKVADQAQLIGLIQQAQEIGLELISVKQTRPSEAATQDESGGGAS